MRVLVFQRVIKRIDPVWVHLKRGGDIRVFGADQVDQTLILAIGLFHV